QGRGSAGAPGAAGAAAPQGRGSAGAPGAAGAAAPQGRGSAGTRQQRLFVKIAVGREHGNTLAGLQALLQEHTGPLPVVLFYEHDQRSLALPDRYRVKPSPDLLQAIETLLGPHTAVIK
ncbi:hypothetical protein, partial [Paenibacillus cymbidii]|uniref:hypothetical protein n=1 Tax=Paenibacillus cymbidii TaxID=1639034 RepID=UPI0014368574